jgi:hypothetical protein
MKRGIVLFELMIMLALCAVGWWCTMAYWRISHQATITAQIDRIRLFCLESLYRALYTGLLQHITIRGNRLIDDQGHEIVLDNELSFGVVSGTYGPPGLPQALVTDPVTFPGHTIVLHPSGVMNAGTLYLVSRDLKTGYALSSSVGAFGFLRWYTQRASRWVVQ